MRRRALVVCLAALCVLAGCNALAPGGSGGGRTAPSVTPAAVPDGTAGDVLAPGLTEASVDAEALFAAHSAVLANESVTVEERHRRTVDRAVTHESATTTRYGPARRVAHVEGRVFESALSPYDRESRWANGSVVYVRSVGDGVTAYDRQRPPDGGAATPSFEARENDLRRVLGALRVDGVERLAGGGRERYLVEATVPEGGDRCAAGADDPVPATVRLLVDDRGLVRAVEETSVRCRERGQRSHNGTVVRTTRYTAVGETAVGRPDWVVDARERIADRKYVAPGVTTERVVDAYALQRAHERALANTTFRGAAERVAVREGSVVASSRWAVAVNRSTNRAFVRQRPGGRGDRVATWASGAVGYQRRADWEATEYASLPGEVVRRATASDPFDPRLPRTLVLAETTVTALGDGRYRVTARAVPAGDGTRPGYERLSFVVDDRGLVHALESVRVGPDRRTTRRFDLDPGGPVPPERPGWVAAAANATDA